MLLEEPATAGNLLQNSQDAGSDPEIIGKLRTRPGMLGGLGESEDGLEESFVHGDGACVSRH
jgi:hypothetical protein